MESKPNVSRRMTIMLIFLAVLFGGIAAYKIFVSFMIKRFLAANQSPVVTVATTKVGYSDWQTLVKAAGSLRAVQGVNVTTQLAGMVQNIYFTPGTLVKKDTLLVQLNIDPDTAQLHSLQAAAKLALITYNRDKLQYAAKGISKQQLDSDLATLDSDNAQVAEQIANIAKKTITAPFTGQLGVSAVNLGQYINPGDTIVTLQQLDPIYVDFYVPQQELPKLKMAQEVNMTVDGFPDKTFSGKITTINPITDVNTRNIEIEATIPNADLKLLPGMFSTVYVIVGEPKSYLTVPETAITYNPYGNLVFLVKQDHTVMQQFVTTGDARGDQITILKGLNAGDEIVASGQLKLKNGTKIAVNNSIMPSNNPTPDVLNEH